MERFPVPVPPMGVHERRVDEGLGHQDDLQVAVGLAQNRAVPHNGLQQEGGILSGVTLTRQSRAQQSVLRGEKIHLMIKSQSHFDGKRDISVYKGS